MNKVNYNKNKGFTLVELLAVIIIVSLISSIAIYSIIHIVNDSKEKSYQVTINNIENAGTNYAYEELSKNIWIDRLDGYQYQCISIENLIDLGYFKNDILDSYVSNDRKVKAQDYIYIERNANTKTITKTILLIDEKYNGFC